MSRIQTLYIPATVGILVVVVVAAITVVVAAIGAEVVVVVAVVAEVVVVVDVIALGFNSSSTTFCSVKHFTGWINGSVRPSMLFVL